ncbi:DUF937 domain-containing protein [Marinicella sp. W31]|uniref:DUF937 domain-containing protein n=1 Tax=Marinicella sp. W31 TaxID=3023713 RepID=UPI003757026D
MSQIMDMITSQLGSGLMDQVASKIGGNSDNTQRAVAAALPLLLGALRRNAKSENGAASLNNALQRDHDGGILGNLGGLLTSQDNQSVGSKILGHVLGSKQNNVSRQLGQATGLGDQNAGQLLSMLAPVVMGALGKAKRESSLSASGLQDLLNSERSELKRRQPQMGALESMLDSDGDGDVDMKDVLSKGSGLLGAFFKR